jgi:hypothetical protein
MAEKYAPTVAARQSIFRQNSQNVLPKEAAGYPAVYHYDTIYFDKRLLFGGGARGGGVGGWLSAWLGG